MRIDQLPAPQRRRRGNYAVFVAASISIFIGFGALSVDMSYARLAQRQAQDIADAAAQAALFELRRTGGQGASNAEQKVAARNAADTVVLANRVANGTGDITSFEFGQWVDTDGDGVDDTFCDSGACAADPNSVRVRVAREGDNPVPLMLSKIFGVLDTQVAGQSVASSRRLETVVVMDITNSYRQADFLESRAAAVLYGDIVSGSAGPDDRIGMALFTGRWGIVYTPLESFPDWQSTSRARWEQLTTASKATATAGTVGVTCNTTVPGGGGTIYRDNQITAFEEGRECFPGINAWREFSDENGTPHFLGLEMARDMLLTSTQSGAYRAIVLLTDGQPAGVGNGGRTGSMRAHAASISSSSDNRALYQHVLYEPNLPNAAGLQLMSVATSTTIHVNLGAHIWFISFLRDGCPAEASRQWMINSSQGDGFHRCTATSTAIAEIFQDIAEALPVVTVQ